jgi:hypothetical protein
VATAISLFAITFGVLSILWRHRPRPPEPEAVVGAEATAGSTSHPTPEATAEPMSEAAVDAAPGSTIDASADPTSDADQDRATEAG